MCFSKEGTISWLWPSAIPPCYQVSLATRSSLLCYRESRFCLMFPLHLWFWLWRLFLHCSQEETPMSKPFSQLCFFCWKLEGCERGSEAYLTSHSFDHLTYCSFLPLFHIPSYLALHPLEESGISIPQHTQPPGECYPGITLAADPVGCGPTGSVSCLVHSLCPTSSRISVSVFVSILLHMQWKFGHICDWQKHIYIGI